MESKEQVEAIGVEVSEHFTGLTLVLVGGEVTLTVLLE